MATVYLIACAKSKTSSRVAARDLYVSSLFTKSRDYAIAHADRWFILSAKHGLLPPEKIIPPYDETLNTMSKEQRQKWSRNVSSALLEQLHRGDRVVILAGLKYREFISESLREAGYTIETPVAG